MSYFDENGNMNFLNEKQIRKDENDQNYVIDNQGKKFFIKLNEHGEPYIIDENGNSININAKNQIS